MTLVLSGVGIEHNNAPIDVTIGYKNFVSLCIVACLGGPVEVFRIVASGTFTGMTNLKEEFAVLVELQDLCITHAVTGDPEIALGVDGQPVLVRGPFITRARATPSFDEMATGIEFRDVRRRDAAIRN